MSYTVKIKKKAEKQLNKLSSKERNRALKKLNELKKNHHPSGTEKLQGVEGYRLRAGDYRILFTFNKAAKEILIYRIKHRKEVYRFK